jgi:hypothetical protein
VVSDRDAAMKSESRSIADRRTVMGVTSCYGKR